MRRGHTLWTLLVVGALMSSLHAQSSWIEQGDAGDLPETAQLVTRSNAIPCQTLVRSIQGNLGASDADMYVICITDPNSFSATTIGGADFDTQLWLFDCAGRGVVHNDDTGFDILSTIDNSTGCIRASGIYLLAISRYNLDPVDANGALLWDNAPFGTIRCPDGPGAGGRVRAWTGPTIPGGAYTITLQGAYFVSACQADVNQDGIVDDADLLIVLFAFGGSSCPADVNRDGIVDDADLLIVLFAFGSSC